MVAGMTRFAMATILAAAALLTAAPAAVAAWSWPLAGEVITPYRNGDDPYAAGQHRGIDIAGPTGAPVVAAVPGLVRFAGTAGSSGRTVSVRSGAGRFDVSYLHLSSIAVHRGDQVPAGALIGAVGTTGVRSAERPHLHFGVREAGSRHAYLDPLTLLPPPATPAPRPPQAVPVAAPAPARRAPSPVPVPRTPAVRAPNPEGRRAPVPRPAPARVPRPERLPQPVGGQLTRPSPAHAEPGRATAATTHGPARVGSPAQVRLGAVPRAREVRAPELPAGAPERPANAAPGRDGGGLDLGRIVAVAGLLAVALLGAGSGAGGAALRTRVRERASSIAVRCRITSPRRSTT